MKNKKKNKKIVYLSFERYLAQQLKNKKFREAYEEEGQRLEIAYRILQLRKQRKLSQKELACKLNTTQSVIARMEAGRQNFTTDTLQKISSVFNRKLKIEFVK
ncbi:MAG: transcriptional regulator [Parcubacteria group bacterium CG11_big_fil_rev_8_21_14_0_20_39_14]|nr:MAG: transcriptional regulator [Parcubacteria group bacterium CG11_big_fil_rev_8_21_14_0_20_39_14]